MISLLLYPHSLPSAVLFGNPTALAARIGQDIEDTLNSLSDITDCELKLMLQDNAGLNRHGY